MIHPSSSAVFLALTAALAAALTAALPAQGPAQGPDQQQLIAQRDAKLRSAFLKQADWVLSYEEARAVAGETGKPIFAYFSRSYAPCPPCKALEDGTLSEEQFRAFAQDVVLYLHVTSHVDGDPHPNQLREKGGSSFPYLVFLDAAGDPIARPDGDGVDALRDALEGPVAAFRQLVDAARDGGDEARARLFRRRVELGHFLDFEAARREMAAHAALTEAERRTLEQQLVDQEFNQILGTAKGIEDAARAGAQTRPMLDKGRIPTSGSLPLYYWAFLGQHGAASKDAALVERAIAGLRPIPRGKSIADQLQKVLDGLRKDG
jgi:hypothetical protein